jgi:di/tricarboxylate transporter
MSARLPLESLPALPDPEAAPGSLHARRRRAALGFVLAWILVWTGLLAAGLIAGLGHPAGSAATPVLLSGSVIGQPVALELLDAVALACSLAFGIALMTWPLRTEKERHRLVRAGDLTREVPWRGILLALAVLGLLLLVAQSGVVGWLQHRLPALLPESRSPLLLTLVLVTVTIFATEVLNNTTVSTVMFPVTAVSAPALGADPLLAMLGVSLASTCAFMTPVATPVNALALASLRDISLRRFLWCGLWVNVVAALWITLGITWVVPPVLHLFGAP